MIKLTFALVRLPELTREAFQAYWFDHHAPLVKSVAETLRIRRYVQTTAFPPMSRPACGDLEEVQRTTTASRNCGGTASRTPSPRTRAGR